jgi:hypothetical protein
LDQNVSNPDRTGINSSALVGRYQRNSGLQYDLLAYSIPNIGDVGVFTDQEERFYIDIFTTAPVGTQILLQLEDDRRNGNAYPAGRHSRYEVFTTTQNQWERLEFQYLDRPDAFAPNTRVNQATLLFDPDARSGYTFFFDNFDVYARGAVVSVEDFAVPAGPQIRLVPNPATDQVMLWNESEEKITSWYLLSATGQQLRTQQLSLLPGAQERIPTSDLAPGVYLLQVKSETGAQRTQKLMITQQ